MGWGQLQLRVRGIKFALGELQQTATNFCRRQGKGGISPWRRGPAPARGTGGSLAAWLTQEVLAGDLISLLIITCSTREAAVRKDMQGGQQGLSQGFSQQRCHLREPLSL